MILETSLKNDQDLKNEYETNPTAARVFDLAVKLEGTIRSHGVHAAGVVISDKPIYSRPAMRFLPGRSPKKRLCNARLLTQLK